jgi:hypothetical protein
MKERKTIRSGMNSFVLLERNLGFPPLMVGCLFVCCCCCRCSSWSLHPTHYGTSSDSCSRSFFFFFLNRKLHLQINRELQRNQNIYISLEFIFFATTALVTKPRNCSRPFDNSSTKNKRKKLRERETQRERERNESMEEQNCEREEQLH